jgi:RNA polymerase sigma factor (sigma-70 family)
MGIGYGLYPLMQIKTTKLGISKNCSYFYIDGETVILVKEIFYKLWAMAAEQMYSTLKNKISKKMPNVSIDLIEDGIQHALEKALPKIIEMELSKIQLLQSIPNDDDFIRDIVFSTYGYCYKSVLNYIFDEMKSKKKYDYNSLEEKEDDNIFQNNFFEHSCEKIVEKMNIISNIYNNISEKEKRIFDLYYIQNNTYAEISSIENISQARISQIIKTIRNMMLSD